MKTLLHSEALLSKHQTSFIKAGFLRENRLSGLSEKAKYSNCDMAWGNYNGNQGVNYQSPVKEVHLNKKIVALPFQLLTMKKLDWLLLAIAACTIAGVYRINFLR
jgi:hypothetical protein